MPDSVKVIIGERNGVNLEDEEELNFIPANMPFSDPSFTATDANAAIIESKAIANSQRYTLFCSYNGTVGNGTFIGYLAQIPGDSSPIIIPRTGTIKEFTFSNSRDADFNLEFRINTLVGAAAFISSKTSTQYFLDTTINLGVSAGDRLYIKYIDTGANATNAVIVLFIVNS